jgi:hypothetical protein
MSSTKKPSERTGGPDWDVSIHPSQEDHQDRAAFVRCKRIVLQGSMGLAEDDRYGWPANGEAGWFLAGRADHLGDHRLTRILASGPPRCALWSSTNAAVLPIGATGAALAATAAAHPRRS